MPSQTPVTCQIRYTLDLNQLDAFRIYARTWIALIERHGGIHHGYFLPRAAPEGATMSFPKLGYAGPADVALAMFTFPDEESYRRYRETVASEPKCRMAAALVREPGCFTQYERLFLTQVE